MKTILLNSAAAAALAIGISAAYAQAPADGGSGGGMQPPAASGGASGGMSAPSGDSTPKRAGGGAGAQGGASAECPPDAANCGAAAGGGASAQGQKMREENSRPRAQGEKMRDEKSGTSAQGDKLRDDKSGKSAEGRSKDSDMKQGRAAASAEIGTEQKTRIRDGFRDHKVDRVNLEFNVNIGTAIPANVHTYVHPVPVWLVEIVPAYRGYDYIVLADGRIVILEPRSYEVITIISV